MSNNSDWLSIYKILSGLPYVYSVGMNDKKLSICLNGISVSEGLKRIKEELNKKSYLRKYCDDIHIEWAK